MPEMNKDLKTSLTDVDQGSSIYVVTYLTRKHGANNKEVFFEYGPQMDVPSNELKDGSFNGIGDNMKWSEILWKFSLEGTPYILRAPFNSPKMGLANSGTLVTPPSPPTTKFPDGSVLSVEDLRNLKSYPFNESGSLRDARELDRDGQVVFIDTSDYNGQDQKVEEVLSRLKSSDNMKNAFNGMGPEFSDQKSLMFAGAGNSVLRWPDGTPDIATSKKVAELLKKEPEQTPDSESKFEPIDNGGKSDHRFAENLDVGKTQDSVDKLNKSLAKAKDTAKSMGLLASTQNRLKVAALYEQKKNSLK